MEDGPVYSLFGKLLQMIIVKVIESEPKLYDSSESSFFNTNMELYTVQDLACKDGHICVEDAPVYSLFGKLLQMIKVKGIESEPKLYVSFESRFSIRILNFVLFKPWLVKIVMCVWKMRQCIHYLVSYCR